MYNMVTYNLTNASNANNFYELLRETNTLAGSTLAASILFLVFIILLIALKNYDTKTGFIASSFVTTILAGLMLAAQFISWQIFLFPCLIFFASLIYKIFTD